MGAEVKKRIKPKTSLKLEFSVYVMLILLATTVTLTWSILNQEKSALTKEVTRRGVALAQYVAAHGLDPFLTNDKLTLATLVGDVMKNENMVYALIVDRNNRVIASDQSDLIGKAYQRPEGAYPLDRPQPRVYSWHDLKRKEHVMDVGIPIILEGKTKIGEVHIGISQSTIEKVVGNARRKATGLAGIFLLAGLVGSIVMVTWMLRPVSALSVGAEEIGSGNLDYTIPTMRRNELGQLAMTFNKMTQELKVATERALEQERIEKELQVAHQIQHMLLPKKTPEKKGYSFGALYRAAKEVGGDYYDFFDISKDQVGVTVADVCGKGIPAAMLMSVARSSLKSLVPADGTPTYVVQELNRLILDDLSRSLFITLFYAVLDIKKKTLVYTSAGHNPGLVYRAKEKVTEELALEKPCLPLGLDNSSIFKSLVKERKALIKSGDVIILYTDGVTEAMNEAGEEYGMERLEAALANSAGLSDAEDIVKAVDNDINSFTGQAYQNDDIAIIAIKAE